MTNKREDVDTLLDEAFKTRALKESRGKGMTDEEDMIAKGLEKSGLSPETAAVKAAIACMLG